MPGRDVVELDVRLRLDSLEPATPGNCTLTKTIGGLPVIVVRDLIRVDELKVGHIACMLLAGAEYDEELPRPLREWGTSATADDAVTEFDRNRRKRNRRKDGQR